MLRLREIPTEDRAQDLDVGRRSQITRVGSSVLHEPVPFGKPGLRNSPTSPHPAVGSCMSIENLFEEARVLSRFAYPGILSLDRPANGPFGSCLPASPLLDLGYRGLVPVIWVG